MSEDSQLEDSIQYFEPPATHKAALTIEPAIEPTPAEDTGADIIAAASALADNTADTPELADIADTPELADIADTPELADNTAEMPELVDNIAEMPDDATPKPGDIQFGPTDDGAYITPYQTTIVYHEDSVFETAVATLSAKAQLIPLGSDVDFGAVAPTCEHISPEVLIFGTQFSKEDLNKFFERGFHFIHVFARDTEAAKTKYYDGDTPYDERMVVFGTDTFYEHVVLLDGLTPIYLLEHIMCASFPDYKSVLANMGITNLSGRHLLIGIEGGNFSEKLLGICSTFKGFERIHDLTVRGKAVHETREAMANQRIAGGVRYSLATPSEPIPAISLSPTGVQNEILNLLPIHPTVVKNNVRMAVMHTHEPHTINDTTEIGFRFVFVSVGNEPANALETLRTFAPDAVGTNGIASAWIPANKARSVLSYL